MLSHITIVETKDSGERGMNPVAMAIISAWKEYLGGPGIEPGSPVFKSATLLTELWSSAKKDHSSLTTLKKEPLENIVRKEENTGN